ncbi:MAG: hypothetical protein GZ091_05870 [Paludibacter sp.]|nr:hypothetical protein [Paludibacter sp.]
MSEIYESTFSFSLVKKYVHFTLRRFFSEFIVIGKENIPADVPVIFAPNHNNALIDALAIHVAAPEDLPIVFLARADIFKNKTVAKFLRFCKMMPAFRMRDGIENLEKNNDVFTKCVNVLQHKKPLGIMPEGNQGEKRQIRPLLKGIFRIAFTAQENHGINPYVKIIPVGIDYGDFTKSQKHIILSFGKPIEVSDYMTEFIENPVKATNEIRNRLKNDLSNLTVNLATETYYDCYETATEVTNRTFQKKTKQTESTVSLFVAQQRIAERLIDIERNEPETILLLDTMCKEYNTLLKKMNLKTPILENAPYKPLSLILEFCCLFITSILFISGFILNFLPFFTPVFLRKYLFKTQYSGFFCSLHYGLGLITFPFFYVLQTILFSTFTGLSWWLVFVFFMFQYFLGKFAISWNSRTKKFLAKLRCEKYLKSSLLNRTQELRFKIIQLVNS